MIQPWLRLNLLAEAAMVQCIPTRFPEHLEDKQHHRIMEIHHLSTVCMVIATPTFLTPLSIEPIFSDKFKWLDKFKLMCSWFWIDCDREHLLLRFSAISFGINKVLSYLILNSCLMWRWGCIVVFKTCWPQDATSTHCPAPITRESSVFLPV